MSILRNVRRIVALLGLGSALLLARPGTLRAQEHEGPQVLRAGHGWRLLATDPVTLSGQTWEVRPGNVPEVPVSAAQQQFMSDTIAADPEAPGDTVYFDKATLDVMEAEGASAARHGVDAEASFGFSCGWKRHEKVIDKDFSESFEEDKPFSGPFDGRLRINLPISGHINATIRYKRFECGIRTPAVKPVDAWANGNVLTTGEGYLEATATGKANFEKNWHIAEPRLGSVSVGWFTFVFSLPVSVGVKLDAELTGSFGAQFDANASGTFNYYCKWGGPCSGTSDFTDNFAFVSPVAGAELKLGAEANAHALVRVSLYHSSIAYVEGGIKAYARADIWGYYGNACGYADQDGNNEWVQALTADLRAGYKVAYGWGLFNYIFRDRDYTGGQEWLLAWNDLLGSGGSTALQPMLHGPGSALAGSVTPYTVRMRPCYPYGDGVTFTLGPGTWTGPSTVDPDGTGTPVQGTFGAAGPTTVTVVAVSDGAGRALNSSGSRTINVTSPSPQPPSGLAATLLAPTTVKLTWVDKSNNETEFVVQRRQTGTTGWGDVLTAPANATTINDSGLSANTSFDYRVRAMNGTHPSTYSNVVTITTSTHVPNAPSNLGSTLLSPTSVRLTWTDNSNDETGFEIQRRTLPSGAFAGLASLGANAVTYTDNTPASMTGYEYRIRASNSYGSSYSAPASITMPRHPSYQGCYTDSSARALPAYLSTGGQTVESCRALALNAGYKYAGVQYHGHCFGGHTLGHALVSDSECNTPCTANNAQTCGGAWRNSVYDTGYVPPPPAGPTNLAASAQSSSSVRVTWTDNSNNETQFNLQRRPYAGTWAIIAVLAANTTAYSDAGLAAATTYEYRVRAMNGGVGSAFSNTAVVTTPSGVPNPPSGFSAWFDTASRTIRTSWADNSNNETGFNVQFSYSGSAFSDMCNTGANATSCSSGPNPPAGSYQLKVRAINGANQSAFSNVAWVTLTAPPPPAASIAWIQPAEQAWGPAGTLTAAGYASNGSGGVQLVWRERSSTGVWGPWNTVAWAPMPSADTTWSNTISSGNPTNKCHWFDAYLNYSGISSAVYQYRGTTGCP